MKNNIGDIIQTKYGSYQIIDSYMKHRYGNANKLTTLYLCKCTIDKNEFELTSWDIAHKANCPICGVKKIIPGNSLYDVRPDLLKYIKNPEDAKSFAPKSGKSICCKCPNCGNEKNVIIENLYKYGFGCNICGDGVSYPNKFMNEFLNQLGVNHVMEKTFDWCPNRRYDQYLPDYNMIIENHGEQHYKNRNPSQFPHQDLISQQKNDNYKEKQALNNNIENYICINCSVSSIDWIKQQIMASVLPIILQFEESDINWEKCGNVASTSLVIKARDLWDDGLSVSDIAEILNISNTTVRNYLKCINKERKTNSNKKYRTSSSRYTGRNKKPIFCVTDGIYFASRFDCEKYYKDLFPKNGTYLLYKNINKGKPYKGKDFIYITHEEFNNKYNEAQTNLNIQIYGNPFRMTK